MSEFNLIERGNKLVLVRRETVHRLVSDRRTVHTGGGQLPDGDSANRKLRWYDDTASWQPVPEVTTSYIGLTTTNQFAEIGGAILFALENGVTNEYPPRAAYDPAWEPFSLGIGGSYRSLAHAPVVFAFRLWTPWPDGGDAPFGWFAIPSWTEWSPNYRLVYRDPDAVTVDLPNTHHASWMRVNGVAYDIQITNDRLPGRRPVLADRSASFSALYVAPPQAAPTVLKT